jgi:hypothetical protein
MGKGKKEAGAGQEKNMPKRGSGEKGNREIGFERLSFFLLTSFFKGDKL